MVAEAGDDRQEEQRVGNTVLLGDIEQESAAGIPKQDTKAVQAIEKEPQAKALPVIPSAQDTEEPLIQLEPDAQGGSVPSVGESKTNNTQENGELQAISQQTAHLTLLNDPIPEERTFAPPVPEKDNPENLQDVGELVATDKSSDGKKSTDQVSGEITTQQQPATANPDPFDDAAISPKTTSKRPPRLDEAQQADSEIQSILEQFEDQEEPADSPRSSELPPRMSSLEKVQSASSMRNSIASIKGPNGEKTDQSSRAPSIRSLSFSQTGRYSLAEGSQPMSPLHSPSLHKALPPAPDPDLPFDFHRFLDQLRHRTADPVAKFLRSFLFEFSKKQWMVHEQIKIISDFLIFITGKMGQCEVWREVSDAEFDNAKEGMEKLVMNRLYSQTYSPAIPGPVTSPIKGRRKTTDRPAGPFRRGQHQEDIERDEILAQKVRIYGWVKPEHLDIPKVEDTSKRFVKLAQQELLKMESYRAPRDKVICVLNCCKVIFGLLKNSKSSDTSADSFMPLLIFVTLQANPEHLVSNVQYILRFRNPDKLGGEAGYYISSLMGAIQFIENLDRTSLTISDEDFEKNVELAVSAIAEKQPSPLPVETPMQSEFNEKGDQLHAPGHSSRTQSARSPTRTSTELSDGDEKAVIGGILKTFQRPLTNIGRMFSDEGSSSTQYPAQQQHTMGLPPTTPRGLSPSMIVPPRDSLDDSADRPGEQPGRTPRSPRRISAEEAAARQASAEVAEAQRVTREQHKDVVDTLAGMFPNLDRDIIDDVVRMKDGRIGSAVDACLALNTGS